MSKKFYNTEKGCYCYAISNQYSQDSTWEIVDPDVAHKKIVIIGTARKICKELNNDQSGWIKDVDSIIDSVTMASRASKVGAR